MKKGISKEYEVESLILNEENVDKLYGNFLKDLKSKIEFFALQMKKFCIF